MTACASVHRQTLMLSPAIAEVLSSRCDCLLWSEDNTCRSHILSRISARCGSHKLGVLPRKCQSHILHNKWQCLQPQSAEHPSFRGCGVVTEEGNRQPAHKNSACTIYFSLSAAVFAVPLSRPVLLAAMRPTFWPGGASRRTVEACPICWWFPPP